MASLQPVLRGVTTEDRTKQTPCAEFDCHGLAEHLMGGLVQLGSMAGVTVERPAEGSLEAKVSEISDQVICAWRAYQGEMSVDGHLPSSMAQAIVAIELLLHGWDLAEASGQTMRVSDEVVAYISGIAGQIIDSGRERGSFGTAVEASADASAIDTLAAFAGRMKVVA